MRDQTGTPPVTKDLRPSSDEDVAQRLTAAVRLITACVAAAVRLITACVAAAVTIAAATGVAFRTGPNTPTQQEGASWVRTPTSRTDSRT